MGKRIGDLSRRELLKLFGISVGAGMLEPAVWPRNVQAQSKKITPRKNARNVIFIQNCGAMSQHETLDFKETKWTAKDLDIQKVNSDFLISKALFPNYEKWAPKASLVRFFPPLGGVVTCLNSCEPRRLKNAFGIGQVATIRAESNAR